MFPLSNWTEIDVWSYIHVENIPVVPLYFAKEREVVVRGESLISLEQPFVPLMPGEQPQRIMCRMRSLGCSPCTGAVRSTADTVPKIIEELVAARNSERQLRDHRSRPGRLDGAEEARGLLLMSGLLRICTAGSVDDGKSTLIGRLLYDSRSVYEDQLHSVREGVEEPARRPDRFLAVHRRPAGRARAGHHDRRRLPLLRDRAPEVHPRRHARPRAVHAQHGDRRVDRRRRDPAGRRAPRRPRAVAAARADRAAARHHTTTCSPSTRWTWSTSTATVFEDIVRRVRPDPAERRSCTRFR